MRSRKRLAEIGAVNVVVGVIASQGGHTALPRTVGPELGSRIVRIVMIHRRTARPVVTVEILAVADRRIERETPDGFTHRSEESTVEVCSN